MFVRNNPTLEKRGEGIGQKQKQKWLSTHLWHFLRDGLSCPCPCLRCVNSRLWPYRWVGQGSDSAQAAIAADLQEMCGLTAQGVYGLSTRLRIYFQWATFCLAYWFIRGETKTIRGANNYFVTPCYGASLSSPRQKALACMPLKVFTFWYSVPVGFVVEVFFAVSPAVIT